MNRRFRHLRGLITTAIVEEDVFGLRDLNLATLERSNLVTSRTPGRRAFNFVRSDQKVRAFMNWLEDQIRSGILVDVTAQNIPIGVSVEPSWTNRFVLDAYRRGVARARGQLIQAGFEVPTLDATGGINASISLPVHTDRLGLLFTRVFNELKGVTDAMDQLIARTLAEGLASGLSPRTLARELNHIISGQGGSLALRDSLGRFIPANRRAQILARTEIIRAHAEAQLQEFSNWEGVGVIVEAEWITAGDNRVCQQCANLEGSIFSIEEARGKLPLHPQCRCAWIPTRV